jgi:hypothetical protein
MPHLLVASALAVLVMAAGHGLQSPALPEPSAPQGKTASIEVFPGATLDTEETASFGTGPSSVQVYRTRADFNVVVNYYRFGRKQPVHIVQENLGDRFGRLANLIDVPEPSPAVLADPFVRRFHSFALGTTKPLRQDAAAAWRKYAERFAGRQQQIGEGIRVTIFRPYLTRTFALLDETVIVLRTPGGTQTW